MLNDVNVDFATGQLAQLQQRIQPLHNELAAHPLFSSFHTMGDLHRFMETHVYAVWDFMSLLKALQRGLTCVDVPWLPSPDPVSCHLVNQIVLGEESDVYAHQHMSHFELYLLAMRSAGASTQSIDAFLALLRSGTGVQRALVAAVAPMGAAAFVRQTFALIETGKLHTIASAFTFGREDLIPDMFQGFLDRLAPELQPKLETFLWYLNRHIEVDGGEHGPMALKMVAKLCGNDPVRWQEAADAAEAALQARLALWNSLA
ncbi:DUF3050 domain-containing protein [Terriglobus albidus]|uniref:DUF3050 domain-containing protein n=1 Tax=Terriglobus albidus TaxID=1592106 RepID=UPI0021E07A78|nr:DUF3050 domain-containing protein [Terriglobus albidus]